MIAGSPGGVLASVSIQCADRKCASAGAGAVLSVSIETATEHNGDLPSRSDPVAYRVHESSSYTQFTTES